MQARRCLFPSVTAQDIRGLIIATQDDRVAVGASDTVSLDQGRESGVQAEDRYAIFQWPLIYKANSQHIHDPDLIFPRQLFIIPRDYTPEDAAAIYRARHRGAWRLYDGR